MKFREIENWDRNSFENKKLGIRCDVVLTLSGEVFWRRAFASTKTTKRWIINLLEAKNWCETIIYECSLIKFSRDDLKIESKLLTFFQYEPIVGRRAKSHNNQQGTVGIESSILDMNLILMSTNVSFFPCFYWNIKWTSISSYISIVQETISISFCNSSELIER